MIIANVIPLLGLKNKEREAGWKKEVINIWLRLSRD
jgi:hypothetical protein